LAGINHLHHAQEFDNLGDLVAFMKDHIIRSEPGQAAWRQMVHKYKGYTGEEMAMGHLRDSGHVLDVPESGTKAGYDVIAGGPTVNGPLNIKVTDNPAYIQQHLDEYPDVPVYTNTEMGSAFSENPDVIVDPNLSAQDCFHTTADTLDGMSDLGDLLDQVPWITLAVSSIKNASGVLHGRKSVGDAIEHTLEDTAAIGLGGWAGGEAGLALGLALAPATGGVSAVVIPAVATLVGSVMGIFTGKGIVGWFKHRHVRRAIGELKEASACFYRSFAARYDTILETVRRQYERQIAKYRFAYRRSGNWFKRTFFPTVLSKFYRLAPRRARADMQRHCAFYGGLIEAVRGKEDSEAGLIVYAQGLHVLCGVSPLPNQWRVVQAKVSAVEREKARVS
jgi:hypothetical protein